MDPTSKRNEGRRTRWLPFFLLTVVLFPLVASNVVSIDRDVIQLAGLQSSVELIRDPWGIVHIYAQNPHDLFFAQGFNAARDRLFQLEMWRRRATGTLAEIQGPRAFENDRAARLFRLRVDPQKELNHYHAQGEMILRAFVEGINSYIHLTRSDPALLPLEFRLLGMEPGLWTPEIVVSRHNGLYRNALREIEYAQLAHALGNQRLRSLLNLQPGDPDFVFEEGVDGSQFSESILDTYRAFRAPLRFEPEDIVDPALRRTESADPGREAFREMAEEAPWALAGSNNWVLSGWKTLTRMPFMANDPHRALEVPSLRYWVHLVAPGWNVIGAGEPALPGVSIGHNGFGAWGLTIFSADQEDIYVYETDPGEPNRYRYGGGWERMKIETETIEVRGAAPEEVVLKFTRHGPVIFEDPARNRAYALRAAWLETGSAPYLGSLRMNQARSWEQFREACAFSGMPAENMVWADRDGNIGWQVVGMVPFRRNWNGLLPVPGDGRFEWEGFLLLDSLPHVLNPAQGYFASANQNNLPRGYPHSVGFSWNDSFRFARILEVLGGDAPLTTMDQMRLQHDELLIPARALVPLLAGLNSESEAVTDGRDRLLSWDFRLSRESAAAALYVVWERRLKEEVWNRSIPDSLQETFRERSTKRLIDWLTAPDGRFGEDPVRGRDVVLLVCLERALEDLAERFGNNPDDWRYGHENFHHALLRHPLSDAVVPEIQARLDVGPAPRGGANHTVNNTSDNDRQTSGASFRIIVDLENWDHSVGTNSPGQSGDPDSPHYRDLFLPWAEGSYFPILYSRDKIQDAARERTVLEP